MTFSEEIVTGKLHFLCSNICLYLTFCKTQIKLKKSLLHFHAVEIVFFAEKTFERHLKHLKDITLDSCSTVPASGNSFLCDYYWLFLSGYFLFLFFIYYLVIFIF